MTLHCQSWPPRDPHHHRYDSCYSLIKYVYHLHVQGLIHFNICSPWPSNSFSDNLLAKSFWISQLLHLCEYTKLLWEFSFDLHILRSDLPQQFALMAFAWKSNWRDHPNSKIMCHDSDKATSTHSGQNYLHTHMHDLEWITLNRLKGSVLWRTPIFRFWPDFSKPKYDSKPKSIVQPFCSITSLLKPINTSDKVRMANVLFDSWEDADRYFPVTIHCLCCKLKFIKSRINCMKSHLAFSLHIQAGRA